MLSDGTFWLDETISWEHSRLNWVDFWKSLYHADANMTFYYLLLHFWLNLGESEWVIRGLSVISGVAAIPAIYILGKKLLGKNTGRISAALLSIHAFHIRYSQESRSYSLLVLLLILSTYFLIRAVESPHERKFWILYVVSSSLAVYSHMIAVLVILAQVLSVVLSKTKQINTSIFIKALHSIALLTGPYIVFLFIQDKGAINWITETTPDKIIRLLYQLSGNVGLTLLLFYTIFIFLAILKLPREIPVSDNSNKWIWYNKLLTLWLLFPIVTIYFVSFIKPMFIERYMLICIPPLVLLASHGLVKLSQTRIRSYGIFHISFLLIVSLSLLGVNNYFDKRKKNINEWKPLVKHLISLQQPGDCIYYPFNCISSEYYMNIEMKNRENKYLPEKIFPYPLNKENVDNILTDYKRMWLITKQDKDWNKRYEELKVIRSVLTEKFHLIDKHQFKGYGINTGYTTVALELYKKK